MWTHSSNITNKELLRQRGIAAVEFAIVLPLVLMLMIATAELSHAFYQYNTLIKSVRDGVRYLAENARDGTGLIDLTQTDSGTGLAISQVAQNLVVYGNMQGNGDPLLEDMEINDVVVTQNGTEHVRINATYDYVSIFSNMPTFNYAANAISTNIDLNTTTSMRAL